MTAFPKQGKPKKKVRTTKVFVCAECGSRFERRSDHKPRNPRGVFLCTPCSRRLRSTGRTYPKRRTGREVTCAVCGKTFYRSGSALLRRSATFCSIDCRSEGLRQRDRLPIPQANNSGARNGRYKHGRRVGHHVSKAPVRRQVIARDGDWCLLCRQPPKGLHLHRVRYGSEGGTYEAGNCVQLCAADHALVHSSKRLWKPLLLAHLGGEPAAVTRMREIRERHRSAS